MSSHVLRTDIASYLRRLVSEIRATGSARHNERRAEKRIEIVGFAMANGDSAATALIARLTLLMLNLALLGLGIALCVMGSNEDGTAGLVKAIYAEGGLTMSAFQKPDAALVVSGAFITLTSLQVRAHARPRIPTGASRPRAP
jgi:hypothetical protein